jgi:DNA-binding response OmpR family regulator
MRVLVVAEGARRREALVAAVQAAGQAVAGSSDGRELMDAVRREGPEALVIESSEGDASLRALLERARAAAEAPLPALLLVAGTSSWLRGQLPARALPARVLAARAASEGTLRRELAEIASSSGLGSPPVQLLGALRFDREERAVRGPRGEARLTASEAALLGVLADGGGAVVRAEQVASALWGRALVDAHSRAAIRSHVHTLRRKLATVGLEGAVVSLPGIGYRVEPATADEAT